MNYIRTIVSAENEMKYIKLQLAESKDYIDKIIVCEFNITHTGLPREYIFEKYLSSDYFSEEEKRRLLYLPGDLDVKKLRSESDDDHYIEQVFRTYFLKKVPFKLNDVLFCLDADEIVFRRFYPELLELFSNPLRNPNVQLPMYQFFYRPDYLWSDLIIRNPVACRYRRVFLKQLPMIRDNGKDYLKKTVGCHFSWNLTIDEMIDKLKNYAHSSDYGHLANATILKNAVKNKKYPFEPDRSFTIKTVDYRSHPEYYPDCFGKYYSEFEYLLMDLD